MDIVKKAPAAKFDESVDLSLRLGVDPKHADQMVRGAIVLPHGIGKTVRVAVFAKGEKEREAREAGADVVGAEDLVEKIQGGFMDFDSTIATPDLMGQVGRLGKVLGPRGLMPNPKLGTVTFDVGRAVREVKAGKVEFRVGQGRQRPRAGRQEVVPAGEPRCQCDGAARSHRQGQAGGVKGRVPALADAVHDDGAGHPGRRPAGREPVQEADLGGQGAGTCRLKRKWTASRP